jgi:hypothetical protein
MRRILASGVLIVFAMLLFTWGFMAHRLHVFPYALLRYGAVSAGLVALQDTRPDEVRPRIARTEAIESLPYLQHAADPEGERNGVLKYEEDRAQPGANLYNSYSPEGAAYLIDMEGNVLHEWRHAYPDGDWLHTELLDEGSVLVVVRERALMKLDRYSNRLWSFETRAHHDLALTAEGDIYLQSRVAVLVPDIHPTLKILDDRIIILTGDGQQKDEISVLELIRNSPHANLLASVHHLDFADNVNELDPIHLNHVEVFDGSKTDYSPLFQKGNILISMKFLNAIAIIDGQSREIIWLWGPNNLALQHQPTLLENGNILLFDNGTEKSRVIEIDPIIRSIVWSYESDDFYSGWGGSVQRLENGNTLITESTKGRVREVTPEGDVVWRFANPAWKAPGDRWTIWRMTRFKETDLTFLEDVTRKRKMPSPTRAAPLPAG